MAPQGYSSSSTSSSGQTQRCPPSTTRRHQHHFEKRRQTTVVDTHRQPSSSRFAPKTTPSCDGRPVRDKVAPGAPRGTVRWRTRREVLRRLVTKVSTGRQQQSRWRLWLSRKERKSENVAVLNRTWRSRHPPRLACRTGCSCRRQALDRVGGCGWWPGWRF